MIRHLTITLSATDSIADPFPCLRKDFEKRTGLTLSEFNHFGTTDGDVHASIMSDSLIGKPVVFRIVKVCGNGKFHWKATW